VTGWLLAGGAVVVLVIGAVVGAAVRDFVVDLWLLLEDAYWRIRNGARVAGGCLTVVLLIVAVVAAAVWLTSRAGA
jgi:hypothetical protein